ncbi:hypothetical protein OIV83_002225 [Microbotryomycetes sp. JL201]|nr:hypothetical protein OIV83_002225 [Microbotryomycetes sp. JL201]
MPPVPSPVSERRRARKAQKPRRAPTKATSSSTPTPTETTECINVSLLLRALLRSAALEQGVHDNLRHSPAAPTTSTSQSPSSSSSSSHLSPAASSSCSPTVTKRSSPTKRVKRELALAGAITAATPTRLRPAETDLGSLIKHQPDADSTHNRHLTLPVHDGTSPPARGRSMRRSASADKSPQMPNATTSSQSLSLAHSTALSPPSTTRMARASSLGPHSHVSHSHQPSPLSRSFGQDDDFATTHHRSTSAGAHSIKSLLTHGEPRARRLEVPKHMQDYEITAA